MASITLMLVIIISLTSFLAFSNKDVMKQFQFNAFLVYHKKQYSRMLTHALVHANWEHLLVNMIVLWSFGAVVEHYFQLFFGGYSTYYYLAMFVGSVVFSSLWSLIKQRNNVYYNAVGASGAVSAVLFAAIFFNPWEPIYFFGVLPMPGIIFGLLYLYYSFYMSRKKMDNIGHDAHFLGAVIGFCTPMIIRPSLFMDFVNMLFSPSGHL
ncbi:MAG: rhomboid family intramembrane serine protease [Prolixibacteraceae bacterium]|jgi:membrane associated rhomboid family serine protease|nr:rhomboid family intramembrane serine protease [Prolixibacteraceae bacterium]